MKKMKKKAFELRQRAQKKKDKMMEAWESRWKVGREWKRGLFHFSVGFAGWFLLQIIGISMELLGYLLLFIGLGVLVFDLLRICIIKRQWGTQEDWIHSIIRWLCENLYRDSERENPGNITKSLIGLGVAWLLCWLAEAPWIATAVCLIFSLVDPIAKLGMLWPIKKFKRGMAEGKSVGGFLLGALGGIIGTGVIVLLHLTVQPFFPSEIQPLSVCTVYFVGVVTASSVELVGGTWDNLLIPASSSIVMVFLYMATMFF